MDINALVSRKFKEVMETPWSHMKAFKHGLIDEHGRLLKSKMELTVREEIEAWPTPFWSMCWRVKRILESAKRDGVESRKNDLISTVMSLREHCAEDIADVLMIDRIVEESFLSEGLVLEAITESAYEPTEIPAGEYVVRGREIVLEDGLLPIDECFNHPVYKANGLHFTLSEVKKKFEEDAPVNAVGTGNIAGASPGQEPPGPKGGFKARMMMKRKKKSPQIDRMDGWPK
jgi:hypothetical protein